MVEHRGGGEVRVIPAKRIDEYARWRGLLNAQDAEAERRIHDAINEYVETRVAEDHPVFCSSWIPGLNWEENNGGVYQPIYESILESLGGTEEAQSLAFRQAGWFFGLIVLDVMISRQDERWECWHEAHQWYEEPLGMFYRLLN